MATDLVVGTLFGNRWTIERALSSGGMGSVYVATHSDTGRRVALKVIKSDAAHNPELVVRFRKETGALASVSHPNVVTFLDSGVEHGTFFLVMELLEGKPLRAVMHQPLEWRRAFRIAADVFRGLSAVHRHGIVHRDLKPENLFLQTAEGHDEIAKLIDFGIARLQDASTSPGGQSARTATGAIMGTPGYISPEQLQGESASPASDVYAVGVILYEMVTGKFPFEAPTPHAMLVRQLIDPLPPPRQALATVPAHVEEVILKLMARDPKERVHTAKDALALIVDALNADDSLPPDAPTESGPELGIVAARVVAQTPPPTSVRQLRSAPVVMKAPIDAPTAPTGIVNAPKQGSIGRTLAIIAGLFMLGCLGMCGLCVAVSVVSKANDDTSASRSTPTTPTSPAPTPTPPADAHGDPLAPNRASTPPTPAVSIVPSSSSRGRGKGKIEAKVGGAQLTLDGIDMDRAARERASFGIDDVKPGDAPSRAQIIGYAHESADDLADCGGDATPVPLRITLAPNGYFHLDTKANTPALACASAAIADWRGKPFKGKPITVDVVLPLGY